MSKAEERAKERYKSEPTNIDTREKYCAYVEGYCQAEKDLKLTWEDIQLIVNIDWDLDHEGFSCGKIDCARMNRKDPHVWCIVGGLDNLKSK